MSTIEVMSNGQVHPENLTSFIEKPDKKPVKIDHNTRVLREGNHIIIPDGMPYLDAAQAIFDMAKDDEAELNRNQVFTCHPDDGRVALMRVLMRTFGHVSVKAVKTMFGPIPPVIERVPIDALGNYQEVFAFGNISIPTLPDITIQTAAGKMAFQVRVVAKRKHGAAINALLDDLKWSIDHESIFKGKSVQSDYTFLDVSKADEKNLILPRQTMREVEANLLTPLRQMKNLHLLGIPFKRGTLLEGVYGTGKTSIAYVVAKEANNQGVTFFYIRPDDTTDIPELLRFARHYTPCVMFIEDIDQFASGERGESLQKLLNELDGIVSKQGDAARLAVIFTTNHVENINRALLRPGRLDAVIHVGLPDEDAAVRLVRRYGGNTLADDFDDKEAGAALGGMTPAFIRECVERAKLHALSREKSDSIIRLAISATDIVEAAKAMEYHLKLATPIDTQPTTAEIFADSFGKVMKDAIQDSTVLKESAAVIDAIAAEEGIEVADVKKEAVKT
jgi:transitional endoplasmic reticulum ATPase